MPHLDSGRVVKEQYVGDISDYRKYALLRRLAATGLKIGVCWMLTPADGRNDGRKLAYLSQPDKWRRHDPELFDILSTTVVPDAERSLRRIEAASTIPNAVYWNEIVPDGLKQRAEWFNQALRHLADTDLIFFDPDNGLDVKSVAKGRIGSHKYAYRDEIAATYDKGHSLLIYQHYPRERRGAFVDRLLSDLSTLAPGSEAKAFDTSHVVIG